MKIKKTFAILIAVLLVLSILPMAFAEKQDTVNTAVSKVAAKKAAIGDAKDRVAAAKEKVETARENYQSAKENFKQAKQQSRECADSETDECKQAKKEVKTQSREFLLNAADKILAMLDKIKEKVESSETISEDERSEILGELEAKVTEITDARAVIENLNNESTAEEIKAAAKTIRDSWKETKIVMKKGIGRLLNARIGGIIVKSEQLAAKLEKVITRLNEKGQDTSGAEELLSQFNAKLEEAKTHWQLAKEAFAKAVTPTKKDEQMKEATEHVREAHSSLKEAHQLLKDIVKALKGTKAGEEQLNAPQEKTKKAPKEQDEKETDDVSEEQEETNEQPENDTEEQEQDEEDESESTE